MPIDVLYITAFVFVHGAGCVRRLGVKLDADALEIGVATAGDFLGDALTHLLLVLRSVSTAGSNLGTQHKINEANLHS